MNQSIIEEYETLYWPQLSTALNTVLLKEPGTYQPISYEQVQFKSLIRKSSYGIRYSWLVANHCNFHSIIVQRPVPNNVNYKLKCFLY